MALFVGLTGNMGSGKTLAARIFEELGSHIIDADAICHSLVEPGKPALKEIIQVFGGSLIDENQELKRSKLAQIVFNDPGKRKILENILHPKVFEEEQKIFQQLEKDNPQVLAIVDAALLIESGNYKNMDQIVVVKCSKEKQINRLIKRNRWTLKDIEIRLKTQMPIDDKIKYADYIIDNNKTVDELRKQIYTIHQKMKY